MLARFPLWKVALIVATLVIGLLYAVPNLPGVKGQLPGFLPQSAMKLGLDLRGGVSLLLEVDPGELETNRLRVLSRDVQRELSTRPKIGFRDRKLVGREVHVRISDPAMVADAVKRLEKLSSPVGGFGGPPSITVSSRAGGQLVLAFSPEALRAMQDEALNDSIEVVRRRIDATGTTEPNIQKQGSNRIVVEVPGLDDPAPLVDVITRSGVLSFNMVDENATPSEWLANEERDGKVALPNDDFGGELLVVNRDPVITGADLQTASQGYDENNRPNISFVLKGQGAERFGEVTGNRENIGKRFAIVLDDRIVSAPAIRSAILTGSGQITGSFTLEEAERIAIVLRAGELPAKLKIVEQRVLSAGLGVDSIRMGVTATIVGIVLTTVFMLLAYGLLGFFALIALYLNVILMVGMLSALQATLTLPGIAGILLTVGMAVDANVLVFERIREEKRNGRSPVASVDVGYDEAMGTIIDSNLTTLLAGVVLYVLGSGPVRGFAVTLAIGIVTSIFTAVVVARWIMMLWLRYGRPKHIPI